MAGAKRHGNHAMAEYVRKSKSGERIKQLVETESPTARFTNFLGYRKLDTKSFTILIRPPS